MKNATCTDTAKVAGHCLSMYLQSWGQSVEQRIKALNDAAEAAGIKARFEQGPKGENAGWRGKDHERAVRFRREIDGCWRGSFEAEQAAIEGVIRKYQEGKDAQ